jgi:APA family basic amino acid/polyamine antiporter
MLIKKEKGLRVFQRFIMPILATLGCIFMMVATCFAHGISVVYYLIVFAIVLIIGAFFRINKK